MDGTAELLTFFARQKLNDPSADVPDAEIPLISVVRDTLGSPDTDVHKLRYLWTHTFATPSIRQKVAAGIPFLYSRFGNASIRRNRVPSEVIDLSDINRPLWKRVRGALLNLLAFYPKPPMFQTTIITYSRNQSRYRISELARASNVPDLYDPANADRAGLSRMEVRELQSRLAQSRNALGHFLELPDLERMYLNAMSAMRLRCAQNWELLRQRAEAEQLYFDPTPR
jgi:hypothetical protein